MNADNFADFIENPSSLHQVSVQDLKDLIVRYPYSANLRLLLTQKSQMEGRKDFEKHLHMMATYSLDRNYLFEQFNAPAEDKAESDNYHIGEDYLQLSGLSTPSESAAPSAEPTILQQGEIEFVEPEAEEETPVLDFTLTEEDAGAESEAVSDSQAPLKDLAKMDDHKKEGAGKDKDQPRKSIIFIEDLIPSKKEVPPPAAEPPQAETPLHSPPLIPPTEEALPAEKDTSPIEEPVQPEEAPKTEEAPEIIAPLQEDSYPLPEQPAEEQIPAEPVEGPSSSTEIPLEITEASRAVEEDIPPPAPKASFNSWRKTASPLSAMSIRQQLTGQTDQSSSAHSISDKKKKKKGGTKRFAARSFELHDDLASETLAKLHIKQGNFEEAIKMYERLCLIFPEKRTFFAEQIEKLKNI